MHKETEYAHRRRIIRAISGGRESKLADAECSKLKLLAHFRRQRLAGVQPVCSIIRLSTVWLNNWVATYTARTALTYAAETRI